MKHIYLYTLTILLMLTGAVPEKMTTYEITGNSRIWIDGTSTVHDWTCDVTQVSGMVEMDAESGTVKKAVLTVPASSIDCNNGTMNKKVATALAVDKNPAIRFTLSNATSSPAEVGVRIEAAGRIDLAGSSNEVTINVDGVPQPDGSFRFTGTLPILMSDYEIVPPTAMLGTLRTGDRVHIRFDAIAAPKDISHTSNVR